MNRISFIAFGAITLFLQTTRTQSITSAEYFIDNDPGPGNRTAFTISAGGTIDENVNVPANVIAGLSDGYHRISCRVLEGDGDWSVALTRAFRKVSPQSLEPIPEIIAGEYFSDVDLGPGNGTPVSISQDFSLYLSVNVSTEAIAALSPGMHRLGLRFQDDEGDWSIAFIRTIN